MNYYEHTFIARQDLSETQLQNLQKKYEKLIKDNFGKILKTELWGLRNLSQEIKKNKKGYYVHFKFEGIGKTIEELEKIENIDEALIRYLTIKMMGRVAKYKS